MRFLTHEEVALLADTIDERYRALVLVAAYCGLRASELVGLRRHHVDLLRRTLTVVEQVQYLDGEFVTSQPKTKAGRRSVALPRLVADELDAHLRAYAESRSDAVVFPAPEGGYLRFDNFRNRAWTPATVDAGLAPLRPHDLRHTCASLAIAAGADIKVLQRMLGHSSAVLTLDRYGHLFPGQASRLRIVSTRWPGHPAWSSGPRSCRSSGAARERGSGSHAPGRAAEWRGEHR